MNTLDLDIIVYRVKDGVRMEAFSKAGFAFLRHVPRMCSERCCTACELLEQTDLKFEVIEEKPN